MNEERMTVRGRLVRYIHEDDYRAPVDRASQIPDFPDDATEQAWWDVHTLSEEFWRNAEPVPESELPPVRDELPPALEAHQPTPPLVLVAAVVVVPLVGYVIYRLCAG